MTTGRRLVLALLATALAGLATSGLAQQTATSEQYFDSDGTRIRYVVRGSGPPVVLVHGFAINAEMNWSLVIPQLAQEFRVIAFDHRGHGKSGKPHAPDAYGPAMVQDVVNLLDHLGIERAHIVGYSMGGAITTRFVMAHPERVRSAVIGGWRWGPSESGMERHLGGVADALTAVADTGGSVAHVILTGLGMKDTETVPPEAKAQLDANDPAALAAVARAMGGLAVSEDALRANEVPTLVLIGERDMFRAGTDTLAAVMSESKLEVLPGRSHITALDDPGFGQAILEFLRATSEMGGG